MCALGHQQLPLQGAKGEAIDVYSHSVGNIWTSTLVHTDGQFCEFSSCQTSYKPAFGGLQALINANLSSSPANILDKKKSGRV